VTLMDTTDPEITFDDAGMSNWVHYFNNQIRTWWDPQGNKDAFHALIKRMKEDGKGKEYDCALGLSGGVDSSYLAYLVKREGLRPLIVHTDAGWNSDIAVRNIENIVKTCGYDLFTIVIDWDEMADLQRSFLRSGVPNQDIPQDHVIFAAFYGLAAKHGIKWVLSGRNMASESILPKAWGHNALDLRHLNAIHRRFGERKLGKFPRMSLAKYGILYSALKGMRVAWPLDLVAYDKSAAMGILEKEFGWKYYGGKHFESRWTRFFQGWWLPSRFGFDKRLAHLSSLILSGQMTREAALEEMKQEYYTDTMMREDRDLILKKLNLTMDEWQHILDTPLRSHYDYPTSDWMTRTLSLGRNIVRKMGLLK